MIWRFLWWLDGILDYLPSGISRNEKGRLHVVRCLGCELRIRWPWLDNRMLGYMRRRYPSYDFGTQPT